MHEQRRLNPNTSWIRTNLSHGSIVFVHGLGANPNTTWRSGDTCWITDLLPDHLKDRGLQSRVRLFTFNYKSFWLRRSHLQLSETANAILQELASDEVHVRTTMVSQELTLHSFAQTISS
jgi:hypothetical protein